MNNVAETIQSQIGRQAFVMMGASQLLASDDALQFAIGKNAKRVSKVRVVLAPTDTYTVEFYTGKGINIRKLAEVSDVYAYALNRTIEAHTGLYLKL